MTRRPAGGARRGPASTRTRASLLKPLPLPGRKDGGYHFPRLGRVVAERHKIQGTAFVHRLRFPIA